MWTALTEVFAENIDIIGVGAVSIAIIIASFIAWFEKETP